MATKGDRVTTSERGTQRNKRAPTQKKCEACGEMFDCGAPEAGCWCEDVKLGSEAAARLRACHTDCVCPRCLSAAAGRRV